MSIIVLSFGLNGIGWEKGCLRGHDERYPLTTFKFLFFRAAILGEKAGGLLLDAMFGLANDSNWLLNNYPTLKKHIQTLAAQARVEARESAADRIEYLEEVARRSQESASKAQAENYALRKVITICSDQQPTSRD